MDDQVTTILREQSELEGGRNLFDTHWLEVAEHLFPRQAQFLGANATPGQKRTHRIFDETAMLALDHFAAAVEGFLIPRGAMWQSLAPDDPDLLKSKRVREWYAAKTRLLFKRRYAAKSGFANQMHESVCSLGAFGNQALWIDGLAGPDMRPAGLHYRSVHIGECYIMENFQGLPDRVNRKLRLTARQAVQKWGERAPECAKKAVRDGKNVHEEHEYIQALFPRRDWEPGRIDAKGKPIASLIIAVADRYLVEESGYRRMPLIYSRYERSPVEVYGHGPGMKVLPAVKAAQEMMRSLVRGAQLAAEPPLGAPHEDVLGVIEYKPRGTTYGAIDERGNRLVQPLFDGADLGAARELLNDTRGIINEAFLKHLFQIQQELKSHVGSAQIMERAGEKGMLLAPVMGRQETEWLDPMTERELDVMEQLGDLDDMPPEVREAGGALSIRYENPLARAQRAEEAAGFFRTIEGITPIAQIDGAVLGNFDFDAAVRGLAEINAVPPEWMKDPKRLAGERAAQAQQQGVQQLLEAAPVASGVARDLSAIQAAQNV
jgi:hypothetical protein